MHLCVFLIQSSRTDTSSFEIILIFIIKPIFLISSKFGETQHSCIGRYQWCGGTPFKRESLVIIFEKKRFSNQTIKGSQCSIENYRGCLFYFIKSQGGKCNLPYNQSNHLFYSHLLILSSFNFYTYTCNCILVLKNQLPQLTICFRSQGITFERQSSFYTGSI